MTIQPYPIALNHLPRFGLAGPPAPPNTPTPLAQSHAAHNSLFDSFQRAKSQPTIHPSTANRWTHGWVHPKLCHHLSTATAGSGETTAQRVEMFQQVEKALGREEKVFLHQLLKSGALTDCSADDAHSTLYHLYAMLTTPRAHGLEAKKLVNETVRLITKPYTGTQRAKQLLEKYAKELYITKNYPSLNRAREPMPLQQIPVEEMQIEYTADCVPASLMFYMADKKPSELVRHLHELTSPQQFFFEKAKLTEISPDDPQQAFEILKYMDIPYTITGPDEVTVKVELPAAARVRAANDSQQANPTARMGIETAYQSALAYFATRSYDPTTGNRDGLESFQITINNMESLSDKDKEKLLQSAQVSKSLLKVQQAVLKTMDQMGKRLSPQDRQTLLAALNGTSRGLNEQEKTLLETIIKDNGGVTSVTYQIVAGKDKPGPGEEADSFLYGYTRPFEKTIADISEVIKMNEFVIIGTIDTEGKGKPWTWTAKAKDGQIIGGHELTITSAFVDKKDNQIKFVVHDSDDGVPEPVIRTAAEIIPRIHHAGLPTKLAKKINKEIEETPGYYVPDEKDTQHFQLVGMTHDPLPKEILGMPETEPHSKEGLPEVTVQPVGQPPALATPPQQWVEYVPIYGPPSPLTYQYPNQMAWSWPQAPNYFYPPQAYYPQQQTLATNQLPVLKAA